MMKKAAYAGLVLGLMGLPAHGYEAQDGDIIFHTSRSAQSLAVQKATASPYSHMGLIFLRQGKPWVLEAVSPVKYTPLAQWQARGNGGHFVIKRLKTALSTGQTTRLRREAETFLGRPYDLSFEWSDSKIYCSELVWKSYARAANIELGALQAVRDFHLGDPAVKKKIQERYGDKVPLDEPVISPVAIFDSALLATVAKQ